MEEGMSKSDYERGREYAQELIESGEDRAFQSFANQTCMFTSDEFKEGVESVLDEDD